MTVHVTIDKLHFLAKKISDAHQESDWSLTVLMYLSLLKDVRLRLVSKPFSDSCSAFKFSRPKDLLCFVSGGFIRRFRTRNAIDKQTKKTGGRWKGDTPPPPTTLIPHIEVLAQMALSKTSRDGTRQTGCARAWSATRGCGAVSRGFCSLQKKKLTVLFVLDARSRLSLRSHVVFYSWWVVERRLVPCVSWVARACCESAQEWARSWSGRRDVRL